jgi:hypothetical protein
MIQADVPDYLPGTFPPVRVIDGSTNGKVQSKISVSIHHCENDAPPFLHR